MKAPARQYWAGILALLAAILPNWVPAASLSKLQSAQHLEISAELIPAENIVVGQRMELAINIATDRWFSGGTRLEIPEVSGLVILQTSNFATNSSEKRGGQSWVIQRWSLDIFPQHSGSFTIPPITARLTVNDESSGNVTGELHSPSVNFKATIPPALARAQHWVASPSYKVSQNFDKDLQNLKVGDAFQRKVVFEATDLMAMMLPTFKVEDIPGLAAYPQPSSLSNQSNRGNTIARRVEHITYVVEQVGNYQLGARDYYWWDTRAGELQMRFLPAVDIQVGQGTGVDRKKSQDARMANIDPRKLLFYAGALLTLMSLGWLVYTRLPRIPLSRITGPIKRGWRRLNQMRKPALPATLNPDGSAGE